MTPPPDYTPEFIKLPTPKSDAVNRMIDASYPLFDPNSSDPLPAQIIKNAYEMAAAERGRFEEAVGNQQERAGKIQVLASKVDDPRARALRTLSLLIMNPATAVLDPDQRVRYGQVDAYSEEGDIDACLTGLVNASAVETVTCVHQDAKVAQKVNDIIEATDLGFTLKEIATNYVYNGNSFQTQIWKSGYAGTLVYNPKNVAVSKTPGFSTLELLYRPASREALEAVKSVQPHDLFYWALAQGWDEYLEMGTESVPLDNNVSSHIKSGYRSYKRYGNPRLCKGVRPISTRQVLDEMRRATIEGVKNQLIFLQLENPGPGEMGKLESVIRGMKSERTGYLIWRNNLTVQHVVPESIDRLMATETWQQITEDIFRNMGIPVDVTGASSSERPDADSVKQRLAILLMEAADIQFQIRTRFLKQWCTNYNHTTRASEKKKLRPSDFMFVPTAFDASYRIQQIIQPLATFGLISYQTAGTWSGLRWDKELQQILRENEEGLREKIMPMTSFSQAATDKGGSQSKTQSVSKPGRTPDRANPNKK